MKAHVSLKTTGVRGGEPQWKENAGKVVAFINDDTMISDNFIAADAFEGAGQTYKRRSTTEITVHYAGREWKGTLAQLAEELNII